MIKIVSFSTYKQAYSIGMPLSAMHHANVNASDEPGQHTVLNLLGRKMQNDGSRESDDQWHIYCDCVILILC